MINSQVNRAVRRIEDHDQAVYREVHATSDQSRGTPAHKEVPIVTGRYSQVAFNLAHHMKKSGSAETFLIEPLTIGGSPKINTLEITELDTVTSDLRLAAPPKAGPHISVEALN